ncbi:MAG: SDR family oxidoreductase [Pirellulales bacterium]|nr:SDR family oxidoreductase [Pirellulales bacterium]
MNTENQTAQSHPEEKTALITGGAGGIGWGIAVALARAGYRVAITDLGQHRLDEALAREDSQPAIVARSCDVTDRDQVAQLFDWFMDRFGRLDVLSNNAGINVVRREVSELDPDDWDRIMNVNCTGTFNCIKAALPIMRKQHGGLIVNTVSIAGKRALTLAGGAYAAAKFGQGALGLIVGQEEAEHGIRVTNIYPGEVATGLLAQRPVPVSQERRAQMVQPENIGDCVVHVASMPPTVTIPELVITPVYQKYY